MAAPSPIVQRLGRSGPFGFGGSALGNLYAEVSDGDAIDAVNAAWAAGVRYFDTAPFYGFGLSEQRLGEALRGRDRAAYLLSTKAGRLLVPAEGGGERDGYRSPLPFRAAFDYSYDGVMRSVEQSLERLDTTQIDILYLHDLGRVTHGDRHDEMFAQAVGGGFRALAELRAQGVAGAIGLGVNEVEICQRAMPHLDVDLFLIAGRYTLLDRSAGPFFDQCRDKDIGIVAGGVFASGVLAAGADDPLARYDYAPLSPDMRARVAAMEAIGREFGVPLAAVALRFTRSHPVVAQALLGLRTAGEVQDAIGFGRFPIPDALWARLGIDAPGDDPVSMST